MRCIRFDMYDICVLLQGLCSLNRFHLNGDVFSNIVEAGDRKCRRRLSFHLQRFALRQETYKRFHQRCRKCIVQTFLIFDNVAEHLL